MPDKLDDVKQKAGSLADEASTRATGLASDARQKAGELASDASGRLDTDLKALREDITKLAASVTDLVKGQASTASSTMMGVVSDTRDRMTDHATDARDRVSAATADLESVVERNPLVAITIAMLAGLFMGIMARPRR